MKHSQYITTGSERRLRDATKAYQFNPANPDINEELKLARRDVQIEDGVQKELDLLEVKFQSALLFLDSVEHKEQYVDQQVHIAIAYALNGVKA